ncbi:TraR/DksA family transcriptional regulator [Sphingopyxis sp. YF1]|jgi:RNA polymerase-binding transcription factor DksA|uniref:TraR/DksA family transcriptional regulator n=1 Tax=Sphingopyxis sp. YF1 TaxID=2482763 RepID=UPI001F611AF5|nr:TraR/DksA C4-type zinc finger protein [Sphingopyxis sp. YF1]UNU44724.1 TraR/DksA family transcriptional regulator [Sphingopyxis sp. YF1]
MHNLAEIRADLTARLARLAAQVERIEGEQRTPLDDDFGEQATEREGREILDAEERAAAEEMQAIRHALARLDAGRYGLCTSCGIPIDAARLEAMPTAAHCIECEREFGD